MASIWKGALAFGLVNIPVELRSAVRSAEKLSFRQLDKKHQQPIKYERVSSVDGKTVPWSDIVKGYEISKGKFVVLDDSDFAAAAVEMSRVLEMTDFVPAESIDPRYFESPYFLVPREGLDPLYVFATDRGGVPKVWGQVLSYSGEADVAPFVTDSWFGSTGKPRADESKVAAIVDLLGYIRRQVRPSRSRRSSASFGPHEPEG